MFENCFQPMLEQRNQILSTWGKDKTGKIKYYINNQGFRNLKNYDFIPQYAFFGCSSLFGIGVHENETLVSYFPDSHNYGLAGDYLNIHSIENLNNFVKSPLFNYKVKVIFFWVERPNENISEMTKKVQKLSPNSLQINQGRKHMKLINLMPQIDSDVSLTHPGPNTLKLWAKTIKILLNQDVKKS